MAIAIKCTNKIPGLSSWNASNVPTIKTEPRDASPQPFGIYRAPPELTPSPQPLSPSSAYTHNTSSPYNMTPTVTGNHQLISPNHQYNANNVGPSGSNNVNPNAPLQIGIGDYNAFGQQPQQQQIQTQQQYHGNNFGSAGATHWETKFNPAAATTNNNLDNLTTANAFTMHNLLTPPSADVAQANGTGGAGNNWNLGSNHFHPQQHHLQQHQQYQQQTPTNDAITTANNTAVGVTNIINGNNENNNNDNNNTNNNNNEHGLSNLLTFDSGQLVRMNSEDQQMLRLNSEDLQISNLSIST